MRAHGAPRAGVRLVCGLTLALATSLGCSPQGDDASPSVGHDAPLPIPSTPGADWNCGERCFRDPDLPEAASRAFELDAQSDDEAPVLVYPLDGSVHPLNLTDLVIQFRRESTAQVWFQISLTPSDGNDRTPYDFVIPCTPPDEDAPSDQCIAMLPEQHWRELAEDNAGRALQLTVTASARNDSGTHRSAARTLEFSADPLSGGFYYWSTALGGTYRLPFGSHQAVPWIAPNTQSNPSSCGGCHAVSRNGNVIAFTADAAAGYLQVADAADPTHKRISDESQRNSSMLSLNQDGSRLVGAYDGRLTLLDTETNSVLDQADKTFFGNNKTAFFPEISADGQRLVVTLSDAPDSFWSVVTGEIATISLQGDRFGDPTVIVSSPDEVHFYPSWSPDGEWIVFASAPIFSLSYDQPNARLRAVRKDGGAIYELGAATQGVGNTSTLPKFAPFVQSDGTMFFTFNSKADYGFMLENTRIAEPAERLPQLWLSRFDPSRLESGDPSSAPVWLPFQQLDQRNHLGLWTERVSCGDDSQQVSVCGPDEVCIDSSCRVLR